MPSRGVGGDVAHGSTDAEHPVKIGGLAVSSTPTAVTAGQRVNAAFDLYGRIYALLWGNTVKDGSGTALIPLVDADGNLQVDVLSLSGMSVPTTTSTPTTTRVASSASSVTLKASNSSRKGLSIYNDSTALLYVSYTTPATTTNQILTIPPTGYWEMPEPITTVAVYGIWASAQGGAMVTETV